MVRGASDGTPRRAFCLLGHLEVLDRGRPLDLGPPKQRALLAMLLVHANRPLRADRLVEDLWGSEPPNDPSAALHAHVSRLRKSLAPVAAEGRPLLERRQAGYVLNLDADDLDVWRFEKLVAQVRDDPDEDGPGPHGDRLREALGLWRGPALAGFADASFARAEAARLEELRLSATEALIEARLALGAHHEVVAELDALCSAHPFRESLWAHRMLALYRCGRQADALHAYQDLRRLLAEEMGIDPSPSLGRLEEAILLQKPELDGQPPPRPTPPTRRPSMPRALAHLQGGPFVGRHAEIEAVMATWAQAAGGERQVLLVRGEPGIGKTRLAAEAGRRAAGDGAIVLYGRADEQLSVPYQPLARALGHYVMTCSAAALDAHPAQHLAELARLLPEVAERLPNVRPPLAEPEAERHRLFEATAAVVGTASQASPVLLVIDDLQWADRASLALLAHLVRSERPMSALFLAFYRDTEVSEPLRSASADLCREAGVQQMRLLGLEVEDVVALVQASTAQPLDEAGRTLAAAIAHETRGNPFFVGAMVRQLAETGALGGTTGSLPARAASALGVPADVEEILARRLARLSTSANLALATAAVAGADFDVEVVRMASDLSEQELLSACDEARAAGLIDEVPWAVDRWSFAHALVRHALLASLTASRRARIHRRLGLALEAVRPGEVAALAHHFAEAAPLDEQARAADYALAAASQALARVAHDEAVEVVERGRPGRPLR